MFSLTVLIGPLGNTLLSLNLNGKYFITLLYALYKLTIPWDAAKHMESAVASAKKLGSWKEVAEFSRSASDLYNECGRAQLESDALAKGARILEDSCHDEAIQMYTDACAILEENDKEQMAFDLYRAAMSVYIKLERYTDAATVLLRWGLAADMCNATHSQFKAYLSTIIVYIYAHDFKQAEKCYNDCSQWRVQHFPSKISKWEAKNICAASYAN